MQGPDNAAERTKKAAALRFATAKNVRFLDRDSERRPKIMRGSVLVIAFIS